MNMGMDDLTGQRNRGFYDDTGLGMEEPGRAMKSHQPAQA